MLFDSKGNGVLVDPGVNTIQKLLDNKINPNFICGIIITHAHADHDLGFWQTYLTLPGAEEVIRLKDSE